jgi:hypothetical protein
VIGRLEALQRSVLGCHQFTTPFLRFRRDFMGMPFTMLRQVRRSVYLGHRKRGLATALGNYSQELPPSSPLR